MGRMVAIEELKAKVDRRSHPEDERGAFPVLRQLQEDPGVRRVMAESGEVPSAWRNENVRGKQFLAGRRGLRSRDMPRSARICGKEESWSSCSNFYRHDKNHRSTPCRQGQAGLIRYSVICRISRYLCDRFVYTDNE